MKPLILITNDDGVHSPGLAAAISAVRDIGDLLVVAPLRQQTTMGRSFPYHDQTGIIQSLMIPVDGHGFQAFGIEGSPAQAVAHGVLELADRMPDLCISGINYGANIGLSLTCSGTVGAAFEADSHGIRSIAVSRQTPLHWQHKTDYPDTDWSAARQALTQVVQDYLTDDLPQDVRILNINVPDRPVRPLKFRWTRQSRFNDSVFVKPEPRDKRRRFQLESTLNPDYTEIASDSDAYALYVEKAISLTPLSWDLTAHSFIDGCGVYQAYKGGMT